MKIIWNINYKTKNIEMLISTALLSAISANILAPLFVLFILQNTLSPLVLTLWFLMHILIFSTRIYIRKKIMVSLKSTTKNYQKYTNIFLFLTSITALMYTYIIWISIFHNISEDTLFLLSSVIIVLSSGSISTLMSVFHFFAIFVSISMFSIISALFYYGGYTFTIYAILLIIFTLIFLRAGYQQYTLIDNLLSLKNSFQSIYEKSSDGICLIKGRKYKDCNPAFLKMLQYNSKEEFFNKNISKIIPKVQENGKSSLKEMLRINNKILQDAHHTSEWIYIKRDGSILWTEIVFTKIYIDNEELIHGVIRDITTKKKLEKEKSKFYDELEEKVIQEVEKNREKDQAMLHQSKLAQMGEMISMIAHQWRQPLTAISSLSQGLSLKANLGTLDKDLILELSNNITEHTQYLSTTINDFREFFRPKKEKKDTTYDEIIESVLKIIESSIITKDILIIKEFHTKEYFYTHPNEIKQVLLNLIKNAEDALLEKKPQNPYIKIKTYKKNDQFILEISDNAGGVPESITEKIFDPYFSTKTEKNGTGLGLYMSKTIIEDHCHGNLTIKNIEDGAMFRIIIKKDNKRGLPNV